MLATMIRYRLDKIIEKYGTDVEILSTGEIMVCSDTGSSYDVLELMDFDTILPTDTLTNNQYASAYLNCSTFKHIDEIMAGGHNGM